MGNYYLSTYGQCNRKVASPSRIFLEREFSLITPFVQLPSAYFGFCPLSGALLPPGFPATEAA